jgi:thiol:disulfide interchange protein
MIAVSAPSPVRQRLPARRLVTLTAVGWLGALAVTPWLLATPLAAQGFDPLAQGGQPTAPTVQMAVPPSLAVTAGSAAELVVGLSIADTWHIQSHRPSFEYLIPTVLTLGLPDGWATPTVTYPPDHTYSPSFSPDPLAVYEGDVEIHARFEVPASASGDVTVPVSLRYQACDDKTCLPPKTLQATTTLVVNAAGATATGEASPATAATAGDATSTVTGDSGGAVAPTATAETAPPPSPATGSVPAAAPAEKAPAQLLAILGFGVLGGLILNVMPCVLPVLSLKIFGIVDSAGRGRAAVTAAGLATASGILVSFWLLAAAAVGARAAGAAVGWGVQFQEPRFVAFLAVVVVLFALNLWGLFEVPLPSSMATWAAGKSGEGLAGHFASGLFATLMATPCSAPFLGSAVGFALGQPAPQVFAVFTAVGVGMALPYLLLAAAPGTARLLPRPGAWMETLRGVMGFLLAAAVVWLLYVLGGQASRERLAAVQLALLALGLLVWLAGRLERDVPRRITWVLALALAVSAVLVARPAPGDGPTSTQAAGTVHLVPWVPFDRTQAEGLAGEGRLVFVDVTADWCFTCKVNERVVLETEPVAAAFARHQVVAMKADWTNHDPAIGAYIAEFGRYGIPFYLLYRPGNPPLVLPELLTQQLVIEAVEAAAAGR